MQISAWQSLRAEIIVVTIIIIGGLVYLFSNSDNIHSLLFQKLWPFDLLRPHFHSIKDSAMVARGILTACCSSHPGHLMDVFPDLPRIPSPKLPPPPLIAIFCWDFINSHLSGVFPSYRYCQPNSPKATSKAPPNPYSLNCPPEGKGTSPGDDKKDIIVAFSFTLGFGAELLS